MKVTLSNRGICDIGDLCTASDEEQQTLARVTEIDLTGNAISTFMKVFDTTSVNSNPPTAQVNKKIAKSQKDDNSVGLLSLVDHCEGDRDGGINQSTKSINDVPLQNGHKDCSFSVSPLMRLSVLAPMKGLSKIHLSNNKLETNLLGLEAVYNTLSYLDVSYNRLQSLTGLEKCTKLTYINVAYNNLTTLGGLPMLEASVGNEKSPMRRCEEPSDHPYLTLIVSHNNLKSKAMKELQFTVGLKLGFLDISFNKIESIQMVINTISNTQQFPLLRKVDLSVNPCLIPSSTSESLPSLSLAASCPHIDVVATHPSIPLSTTGSEEMSGKLRNERSELIAPNRSPLHQNTDKDITLRNNNNMIVGYDGMEYTVTKQCNSLIQDSSVAATVGSVSMNYEKGSNSKGNEKGILPSNDIYLHTGTASGLNKENEGKKSHRKSKNETYANPHHRQQLQPSMLQNNKTSSVDNEIMSEGVRQSGHELRITPKLRNKHGARSTILDDSRSPSVGSAVNQLPPRYTASTSNIRELNDRLLLEIDTVTRLSDEIKITKKELKQKTKLASESMETIRKQRDEIDELQNIIKQLKITLQKKNAEIECARVRTEVAERKYQNLEIQFDIAMQTNDKLSLQYQEYRNNSQPQHHQRQSPTFIERTSSDHSTKSSQFFRRSDQHPKGEMLEEDTYNSRHIYPQAAERHRKNTPLPTHNYPVASFGCDKGLSKNLEREATDVSVFDRTQTSDVVRSSSRGHRGSGVISPRFASRNYSHVDNKGNRACTSRPHTPKRGDFPHAHRSYVYPEDEVVEQVDPLLALKHNLDHRNISDDRRQFVCNVGFGSSMLLLNSSSATCSDSQQVGEHISHQDHRSYTRLSSQSQGDKMESEKKSGQVIPIHDDHKIIGSTDMDHGYTGDGVVHDEELRKSEVEALEMLCDEQSRYIDDICEENKKLLSLLKSEPSKNLTQTNPNRITNPVVYHHYRPINPIKQPMSKQQNTHFTSSVHQYSINEGKTHQEVHSREGSSHMSHRYEKYTPIISSALSHRPDDDNINAGPVRASMSPHSMDPVESSMCYIPSNREATADPSSPRYRSDYIGNTDYGQPQSVSSDYGRNNANQNNDEDERSCSQDSDVPLCLLYSKRSSDLSRNESLMMPTLQL